MSLTSSCKYSKTAVLLRNFNTASVKLEVYVFAFKHDLYSITVYVSCVTLVKYIRHLDNSVSSITDIQTGCDNEKLQDN